jgi:hypothetical protein
MVLIQGFASNKTEMLINKSVLPESITLRFFINKEPASFYFSKEKLLPIKYKILKFVLNNMNSLNSPNILVIDHRKLFRKAKSLFKKTGCMKQLIF